jgi:hypothetical protein
MTAPTETVPPEAGIDPLSVIRYRTAVIVADRKQSPATMKKIAPDWTRLRMLTSVERVVFSIRRTQQIRSDALLNLELQNAVWPLRGSTISTGISQDLRRSISPSRTPLA